MKSEYIIWGKVNFSDEQILVSEKANLKNIEQANKAVEKLASLGCYDLRIQRIDFDNQINFIKTIN